MKTFSFVENDLAIIEALQYAPRAPWSAIGEAVDLTASTTAKRWDHLLAAGVAWSTATFRPGARSNSVLVAYVSIVCEPGSKLAVGAELANDHHALSVDITSGLSDLFVTVAAPNMRTLTRYLLERIDRIPGVVSSRPNIASQLFTEGSAWRLGVLSPDQLEILRDWRPRIPNEVSMTFEERDHDTLMQLGYNGRASYASLAVITGNSEATARRQAERLLKSGLILIRTELAAPLAGWPISVLMSANVPSSRLEEVARTLSRLRQVRLCTTLAGSPNLKLVAWLHDIAEVHRFEMSLSKGVAGLEITDRQIVLKSIKRMGRLLDEDGRAIRYIPMDIWRDPISHPSGIPEQE
jgi:DNA-binding Lrp family transcriptional regulator